MFEALFPLSTIAMAGVRETSDADSHDTVLLFESTSKARFTSASQLPPVIILKAMLIREHSCATLSKEAIPFSPTITKRSSRQSVSSLPTNGKCSTLHCH